MAHYDIEKVKSAARGHWLDILSALAPDLQPACEQVGRHVRCPVHGGKGDGFRLFPDAAEKGGGVCNTCPDKKGDGLALLQWANGWTFFETLKQVADHLGIQPTQTEGVSVPKRKKESLKKTWKEAIGDHQRIADYFKYRGLSGAVPRGFRLHPSLAYFEENGDGEYRHVSSFPAILAPIQSVHGKWLSLHRTYLNPTGLGKAHVECPKKMMPPEYPRATSGGAVHLSEAGEALALTEGVETGLAVLESTKLPTWACLNANGLAAVRTPTGTQAVYIFADNDLEKGPKRERAGQKAAEKLAARLHADGLKAFVLIPEKAGTDWLDVLKEQGPNALNVAVEAAVHWEPAKDELIEAAGPYQISGGTICWERDTKEGPITTPLCNFTARIVGQELQDDGAEQVPLLAIQGTLQNGKALPRITVPAAKFPALRWVNSKWGMAPIITAGYSLKDHLRAAIQSLSGNIPSKVVYSHIGWRKVDDEWVYLHAGGAIGPNGPARDIYVEPGEGCLGDYLLPDPPAEQELKTAIKASFSFINLAPSQVTFPLFASIFRAPLGEALRVDHSCFISGSTGCQKTEVSALSQAHYGKGFHGKNLPGAWSSTANALEKLAFLAKDAVFTVDDFAPTGTSSDVQGLHREADRLLRGQGNRKGRGRMRPDGTLRPEYSPRGLIVSSGEDIPSGQSLRGRMLILEMSPGYVDLNKLTKAQKDASDGLYSMAMSGFIRWLAPQMHDLKESLPKRHLELRARARECKTAHDRTPDTMASLFLGLEMFSRFVVESGAKGKEEADQFLSRGWKALEIAAKAQATHLLSEEPTSRFLRLLAASITSGAAHVADTKTDGYPEEPIQWGWRRVGSEYEDEWVPVGSKVGWVDVEDLYLDPDSAYAVAERMARAQGSSLTIKQDTLWNRMKEKGHLASWEQGRNKTRQTINKIRTRVLHLKAGLLFHKSGPTGPIGPYGWKSQQIKGFWPEKVDQFSEDNEKLVQKPGPQAPLNQPSGPNGPVGPEIEDKEHTLEEAGITREEELF